MSAGLRFVGNQEPGRASANAGVPNHYYIYTGAVDAFEYSITRPAESPPNTEGRYRNCDPLTIGYLIKMVAISSYFQGLDRRRSARSFSSAPLSKGFPVSLPSLPPQ
jgi:hypothetical protein